MFSYSQKFWNLGFTDKLVMMEPNRTKVEILKAVSNFSRYLDIRNDANLHEEFTRWIKRKEIHWNTKRNIENYNSAKRLDINEIVTKLQSLPTTYSNFGFFVLVSGLRTSEAIKAFNNHSELCNEGVMELFWDRGTKKANAVFCHPLLHNKFNCIISEKSIRRHLMSKNLGCELRYLRKINFTMVATKLDPLLAEFMQGRRGNISQRHYFLPLMQNNRRKWIRMWEPILKQFN